MPRNCRSPWVVMKFGGTSVAGVSGWDTIYSEAVARTKRGLRPVIVHSALVGISPALEDLLQTATQGGDDDSSATIKARHLELAASLGLDGEQLLGHYFNELDQLVAGIALIGDVSPRVHARVMALGELMATTLGAAHLRQRGLEVQWRDARELLVSRPHPGATERARYLAASCDVSPDPTMQADFAKTDAIVLTQGFIARDRNGATVLLGRGGSDTTAGYLAARLQARRVEIWTDVPGMYTADPRVVPGARLLKRLDYAEAQEIATTGGKVLHPACLRPLRQHGIPLAIRSTLDPATEGTIVSKDPGSSGPRLKAISVRDGVTLVSMETVGMWHRVGFLAESFACFSRHGVSIDLVSTSETSVTVSLDTDANGIDAEALERIVTDLSELCRVRVIDGCAAVSLVGRQIRAILHELAPAFELFEEQRIHLVSQAANDLNFTFVVDQAQSARLVQRLHDRLIKAPPDDAVMGETWARLEQSREEATSAAPWWVERRDELLGMVPGDEAVFVYDPATLERTASRLRSLTNVDRVFYAMKANAHPEVLRRLHAAGLCFECVSPGELRQVLETCPGIENRQILFTPNFAPASEYALAFELGVHVTLDNTFPLSQWPEVFDGREIFVRIDPGQGWGHHKHVETAGRRSKFGVPLFELEELQTLAGRCGARVVGLHAHTGSGILEPDSWQRTASVLAELIERFPDVRTLDVGGGLGVPEKPDQLPLDLDSLDNSLSIVKSAFPQVELWLEPGRFVVAEAGVLLCRVTQLKGKGGTRYVGLNTGMNSLIRPALYGAYHEIVNLTRYGEAATQLVNLVGPICESSDRLGSDRLLPPTEPGDVILIANTGAYGRVMSSWYNLRQPAQELILSEPSLMDIST